MKLRWRNAKRRALLFRDGLKLFVFPAVSPRGENVTLEVQVKISRALLDDAPYAEEVARLVSESAQRAAYTAVLNRMRKNDVD